MKILIVGCGGIGSYMARETSRLLEIGQIDDDVSIADDDMVEPKNMAYQNFSAEDLLKNKAEATCKKYPLITPIPKRITSVKGYALVILCVDNNPTRKQIITECYLEGRNFIDLRAEGREVTIIPKSGNEQEDLRTLSSDETPGSCQLKRDLEEGIIQNGNIVAAALGSQALLNIIREQPVRKLKLLI